MNFLAKLYEKPRDAADRLLDGITSYRLVLYFLLTLLGWATLISFDKKIPYTWYSIILSAGFLVIVCRAFGELFSRILNISRNFESDYITALILALIMTPATTGQGYAVLAGAGFAAIASKYLLTIHRQHIFNPAAFGAALSGIFFHNYASWWVGTAALAPLVLVGGILIMLKMRRFWMIATFTLVYGFFLHMQFDGAASLHTIWLAASATAVMFFAFVMLIEPLTTPDSWQKYLPYSVLVGVLYGFNKLRISPEEALLIGNAFAYTLVRGKRLQLQHTKTIKEADGIYSLVFNCHQTLGFKAGQYLEWTLPMRHSDSRGNRRYLTISSSPSEHQLMFTVKIPAKASHFKKELIDLKPDTKMLASQLSGSFTLPDNQNLQLAFIAGGIGVTPFRSMVKYMIDKRQERPVKLLYAANKESEFAFKDIFARAKSVGVETGYLTTAGRPISKKVLTDFIPDYQNRIFYLSGPYGFVKSVRMALIDMGVSIRDIKSDYFPGYN